LGGLDGMGVDIDESSIRDFDWMRRAEKSLRPVGFCGTLKLRSFARLCGLRMTTNRKGGLRMTTFFE
jgi:hypothetical protein